MSAQIVVVSDAAEQDIEDIARYIAADSIQSALKFEIELNDALGRVRAFPSLGRRIEGRPALRTVRVSGRFWRYMIVYCFDDVAIEVRRVLHGAMDLEAELSKLGPA